LKMARIALIALLLALSLFAVTNASAAGTSGTFTLSPYAGVIHFEGDNNVDLKTAGIYGLRAGYNFTNNLGGEFTFGYSPSGFRNSKFALDQEDETNEFSTRMWLYEFNGIYRFDPVWIVRPYVEAGVGFMKFDRVFEHLLQNTKTHALVDYGGGAEYSIIRGKLAFRVDLQGMVSANPGLNEVMCTGGLTWFIGGN
jgi:OmpA-OmpF porin, OOP family